MVQYNVWSGKDPVDPEDTTKGWGAFMDFSASFYDNQRANDMFRDYGWRVVTRTNTYNGRKNSEDPTIIAWQLANEPRPGKIRATAVENLPVFYRWIDQTALFLHSLDTNHLVSTGSEGIIGSLLSSEYYLESHKTPHVDYLTMHLWPLNWGWFDPKRIPQTLPETESKALDYIAQYLTLARKLGTPIVMEEFGIDRDGGEIRAGTPTTARDRYFALVLKVICDSARAGAPIARSCFWGWEGEAIAKHADGMWRTGDPFMMRSTPRTSTPQFDHRG